MFLAVLILMDDLSANGVAVDVSLAQSCVCCLNDFYTSAGFGCWKHLRKLPPLGFSVLFPREPQGPGRGCTSVDLSTFGSLDR